MKSKLAEKHSKELKSGSPALSDSAAKKLLKQIPGWEIKNGEIRKVFSFKDNYHTIAFVNAVAWIANSENHHPDLEVGYNKCGIRFSTHSVGGLSESDFICAAKIELLRN